MSKLTILPIKNDQGFAYPAWFPIAAAIQVSSTIMACDDMNLGRDLGLLFQSLPVCFHSEILAGASPNNAKQAI